MRALEEFSTNQAEKKVTMTISVQKGTDTSRHCIRLSLKVGLRQRRTTCCPQVSVKPPLRLRTSRPCRLSSLGGLGHDAVVFSFQRRQQNQHDSMNVHPIIRR